MENRNNRAIISAEIPLAEILRYGTDLRSMTQGRGIYTIEFERYEPVPNHLADQGDHPEQGRRRNKNKGTNRWTCSAPLRRDSRLSLGVAANLLFPCLPRGQAVMRPA